MKSTILLALGLFLAAAPQPDAADIAGMTADFISLEQAPAVLASETAGTRATTRHVVRPVTDRRAGNANPPVSIEASRTGPAS